MGDEQETMTEARRQFRERERKRIAVVAERTRRTAERLEHLLSETDRLTDGGLSFLADCIEGAAINGALTRP